MEMVNALIKDFEKLNLENFIILVRSNTFEDFPLIDTELNIEHIRNKLIKGFAKNHNTNYQLYKSDYFAVINPDLRISDPDIFETFINHAYQTEQKYILCPAVKAPNGSFEDTVRNFPTVTHILKKLLFGEKNAYQVQTFSDPTLVDWAGGMFHFFPSKIYDNLGGYDEKYFLYYEDVDICFRAKRKSIKTYILPYVTVFHDAQRKSHRDLKYLSIHCKSLFRFWKKFYFRRFMK